MPDAFAGRSAASACPNSRKEHTMSLWSTIPLGVGLIAVLIPLIKRRTSSVTALHLDH